MPLQLDCLAQYADLIPGTPSEPHRRAATSKGGYDPAPNASSERKDGSPGVAERAEWTVAGPGSFRFSLCFAYSGVRNGAPEIRGSSGSIAFD